MEADSIVNMPIKKRLSPADRRAQLLRCAVKAYAEMGVERAGHGDVAKLAKVSTATVFNYFPTRKDLTDVVLDYVSALTQTMFSDLPKGGTVQSRILELAVRYNHMIEQDSDAAKVQLNWSVSFGPDVRPAYLAFQDRVLTQLQNVISGSSDERSDARIIYGAATTYAMMKFDRSPEDTLRRFVKRVAETIG